MDHMGRDMCHLSALGTGVLDLYYWYVGFPALDAIEYIERDNWIGVALSALKRMPKERIVELGAEAMRKLSEAPLTEQQRFLLVDCVQAYLPTDEEQKRQLLELFQSEAYQGMQAVNKTVYDEGMEVGMEKGMEKGIEQNLRNAVLYVLEHKFGVNPSEKLIHALKQCSEAKLQQLTLQIATVDNIEEVDLPEH